MSTKKSGTSWQDTISDWLVSIIVAVALAFCIRTFVMRDGKVLVNGSVIEENYIYKDDPKGPNKSNYRKSVVPQGHIFVLGDNRNNSEDSRFADVDFVPLKLVKGEAVVAFWPVERWRMLP